MQVNLNQLRCFYLAVKYNSISLAAQQLCVTPPAITMQIKKLEEWLGFRLICRRKNGIQLAQGVQALYDQAQRIFAEVDTIEQQISVMMKKEGQQLKLGCHYIPAKYILPDLMSWIHELYPGLNIKVVLGSVPDLMAQVRNRDIHFCLSAAPEPEPNVKKAALFKEDLVLVAARNSKYLREQPISRSRIKDIPLILPEQGAAASDIILNYLKDAGVTPCIEMDNLSADIVKNFVAQGLGLAFLVRFTVADKLSEGSLCEVQIKEGPPVAEFSLAYNPKIKSMYVSKIVAALETQPFKLGGEKNRDKGFFCPDIP